MMEFPNTLIPEGREKQMHQWWDESLPFAPTGLRAIQWLQLKEAYSGRTRSYHSLTHPWVLLSNRRRYFPDIDNALKVDLAIFFHDVVYLAQPGARNEERSALWADQSLKVLGFGDCRDPDLTLDHFLFRHDVVRAVVETEHHQPTSEVGKIVCDLDLMGLGAAPTVYAENGRKVRAEYRLYTDDEWAAGREAFLLSFLNRDRIFSTDLFYLLFEGQAMANLRAELDAL